MIPAILFFIFGCETFYSSFLEIFGKIDTTHGINKEMYSIFLYIASFGIELSVIAYNLRDAYKM